MTQTQNPLFESLEGKLLLAMPGMRDPRFMRSVIYMCSHTEEGAMGIAINQPVENITFSRLLEQLQIKAKPVKELPIFAGGPVETGRGFVLHSSEYIQDSTMVISDTVALSATVDILKALASGTGPKSHLLALGYAGWGPGQLEAELAKNSWLSVDAEDEVVFNAPLKEKWPRAMAAIGVDVNKLSSDAGHA